MEAVVELTLQQILTKTGCTICWGGGGTELVHVEMMRTDGGGRGDLGTERRADWKVGWTDLRVGRATWRVLGWKVGWGWGFVEVGWTSLIHF